MIPRDRFLGGSKHFPSLKFNDTDLTTHQNLTAENCFQMLSGVFFLIFFFRTLFPLNQNFAIEVDGVSS